MIIFVLVSLFIVLAALAPLMRRLIKRDDDASNKARLAAVIAVGAAPAIIALMYWTLGEPKALNAANRMAPPPLSPAEAIAAMAPEERQIAIEDMVSGLAARLAADPDDLQGWRMLGRSYGALGEFEKSAEAWREAIALSRGVVDDWRGLAFALIERDRTTLAPISADTLAAFEAVKELEPSDPFSLYVLALAAGQRGDKETAKANFETLLATLPAESPIRGDIENELMKLDSPDEQ